MGPIIEIITLVVGVSLGTVVIVHLVVDSRNNIGFVPMPKLVIESVIAALNLGPHDILIDLGAGDGRILAAAQRIEPKVVAIGYENNPVLHAPRGVEWHRSNLFDADVSAATCVVAYLSVDLNARLATKLSAELMPGCKIVTVQFELPGFIGKRVEITNAPAYAARLFIYEV